MAKFGEQPTLKLVEGLRLKAEEDLKRMMPRFDGMFAFAQNIQSSLAPLQKLLASTASMMGPVARIFEEHRQHQEVFAKMFAPPEPIRYVPPPRPASAHEIANIVIGRLEPQLHRLPAPKTRDAIIEINVSATGRLERDVNGAHLVHDLGVGSMKTQIILDLMRDDNFMTALALAKLIQSKDPQSVRRMIGAINAIVQKKLKLSKTRQLIESQRLLGYRINPFYNLILA